MGTDVDGRQSTGWGGVSPGAIHRQLSPPSPLRHRARRTPVRLRTRRDALLGLFAAGNIAVVVVGLVAIAGAGVLELLGRNRRA
jgi:hypothetical protein